MHFGLATFDWYRYSQKLFLEFNDGLGSTGRSWERGVLTVRCSTDSYDVMVDLPVGFERLGLTSCL